MSDPAVAEVARSPEERSKAQALEQIERLREEADFFGWDIRVHDAGDFLVCFVRIEKPGGRTFVMRLECDDYPAIAPLQTFVDPEVFETADEATEGRAESYPQGPNVDAARQPLPVICIRGHRDFYAGGWHAGWSNPPAPAHALYQHVVDVRNAILDVWS
jgi:hypothetical protein